MADEEQNDDVDVDGDTDNSPPPFRPPPPSPIGMDLTDDSPPDDESEVSGPHPLNDIVEEVLEGKWQDGEARAQRLRAAGHSYLKVEAEVQRRLT